MSKHASYALWIFFFLKKAPTSSCISIEFFGIPFVRVGLEEVFISILGF